MNKATHTSGPWHTGGLTITANDGLLLIAKVTRLLRLDIDHEGAANARLIAAAPDLLEALKYARRFVNPTDVDTAFIDAAIAKATGEAP